MGDFEGFGSPEEEVAAGRIVEALDASKPGEPRREDFASREEFFRAQAEYWTEQAGRHPAWREFVGLEGSRDDRMGPIREAFVRASQRKR